ncbi:T9SS type A sorting domain-containing protein [Hymenobacter monticola]|uniref:T9SS type A sorting domain-containing protein n=1 Tax=Hymenobacter monticola TaxID=1705399 RepID=A0ABY4B6S1_9BACT|nr:T9SS type A sorting domain-containing protein [Hymenobacter monticola]UOE33391.1 T9SS type A sorting domain-containing protein [Hymenobacter monticola]
MKKFLLSLGLLGAVSNAYAQPTVNLGPWVPVNTTSVASFAPGYRTVHVNTVSSNVSWVVAEDLTNGVANYFFATNNATGTEFYFDAISAAGQNATYETANISAVSATTAVAAKYGSTGGGDILRTTTGGQSWTKTTNTNTQFVAANGGFLDFVHMFDANEGVAVGDPTNGYFEILRTTNGGVTWTRIPQTSTLTPFTGEAALVRSFFALGNTIWFGGASGGPNEQERVYKSTDRGITWTVSQPTPLTETISKLAFKDPQNGIAYNTKAAGGSLTAVNVIRTSDGGDTWQPITPNNTNTGSFFWYDIDAVNGRYYSVGQRFPASTPGVAADFGSSYSTDGVTWTSMNSSQGFFAFDLVPGTNGALAEGYAGASTDANGVGGLYKARIVPLSTRDAALQQSLSVFPNPGAAGVFNVELGSTMKAGAQLTVVDAMGRTVKSQTLNATAVGSKKFSIDLSGEKTGVYTLQLRGDAGIATQKLVIN